jgi:hypothetical protein
MLIQTLAFLYATFSTILIIFIPKVLALFAYKDELQSLLARVGVNAGKGPLSQVHVFGMGSIAMRSSVMKAAPIVQPESNQGPAVSMHAFTGSKISSAAPENESGGSHGSGR